MEKKDIIQSVKDSLFTGIIALALFGPIVGLRTASKGEGLFITPQWGIVFILVGLCVLGRFLINLNSTRKTEFTFFSKFTSKLSSVTEEKKKSSSFKFLEQNIWKFINKPQLYATKLYYVNYRKWQILQVSKTYWKIL